MKSPDELLREAADLFAERNAVYGDSWFTFGEVMKTFFPDGLKLETADDFSRFASWSMCLVKLERYAKNFENGGHLDSVRDLKVYAAILEAKTK